MIEGKPLNWLPRASRQCQIMRVTVVATTAPKKIYLAHKLANFAVGIVTETHTQTKNHKA